MDGIPAAERLHRTMSFWVEWRGVRHAMKLQDKRCEPNASTVIPHLHPLGMQTESTTRRATPIRRVSLSMTVPTVLLGMHFSQAPDSGREGGLKQAR